MDSFFYIDYLQKTTMVFSSYLLVHLQKNLKSFWNLYQSTGKFDSLFIITHLEIFVFALSSYWIQQQSCYFFFLPKMCPLNFTPYFLSLILLLRLSSKIENNIWLTYSTLPRSLKHIMSLWFWQWILKEVQGRRMRDYIEKWENYIGKKQKPTEKIQIKQTGTWKESLREMEWKMAESNDTFQNK